MTCSRSRSRRTTGGPDSKRCGPERTGHILSIIATCIAHDVNPRAYLHRVVHCIVHGWPQAKLRDLLPDRMLAADEELYIGDPDALPMASRTGALPR